MKLLQILVLIICVFVSSCNTNNKPIVIQNTVDTESKSSEELHWPLFQSNRDRDDGYMGYVEIMGRAPTKYDYLCEAALAEYIVFLKAGQDKTTYIQSKADEYYKTWKDRLNNPFTVEVTFESKDKYIDKMIRTYQAILKLYPNHPLKDDLLSAINELKKYKKQEK